MRRSLLLTAAGVAALVVAIAFALLGRAVLAAPDRVEAARAGGAQEERSPFDRAADWLLGVGDPDPFFKLVRTYRRAVADTSSLSTRPHLCASGRSHDAWAHGPSRRRRMSWSGQSSPSRPATAR